MQPTPKKPENPYLNLVFNLVIPSLLLMKAEAWLGLSPMIALFVALAFPLVYGIGDLVLRKTWNMLSIIGLVGILFTGGIGLWNLPTHWVAFKEALIPSIIGLVVLVSACTRRPLVKIFLFNETIFQVETIRLALVTPASQAQLNSLLKKATYVLSSTFFLSAGLNFLLAKWIVKSEVGTSAFTEELGKMTLWSYPVILLPSMLMLVGLMWWLLKSIQKLTGLPLEKLFNDPSMTKKSQ